MAPGPISVNKIKNMCSFQTEANPLINLEIGKQLIDFIDEFVLNLVKYKIYLVDHILYLHLFGSEAPNIRFLSTKVYFKKIG